MEKQEQVDVIVIGGSYAGMAAALSLGRAMRKVLILDSGKSCNRQAPHSQNFLTQDGSRPADIAALARKQVLAYPTVQYRNETATQAFGEDLNFVVTTADGRVVRARKLLFATGIKDLMLPIPGFAESWGISTIHCPYCHGYEYRGQSTGLLFNGEAAFEMAMLIRNWTDQLTILANGPATPPRELRRQVEARGIAIEETPVRELIHNNGYLTSVQLTDGRQLPLATLYARPPFEQHCTLPRTLGCIHTEAGYLEVDNTQKTSITGVYAAGDATTAMRAVSVAVAAGMMAGVMINKDLLNAA